MVHPSTTKRINSNTMQPDVIEQFYGQTIQHGKYNDRIYLMKYNPEKCKTLPRKLIAMAEQLGYSKIFAKSTRDALPAFIHQGFTIEAYIPSFFNGKHDVFMVCYYLKPERYFEAKSKEYESILNLAKSKANEAYENKVPTCALNIRLCKPDDISQMASIYQQVFPSYPFPIHNPDYLRQSMNECVDYYCVEKNHQIVALSSAEIDNPSQSAEMTDFATLPKDRGKGYASMLLSLMAKEMAKKSIKTLYTIARAISPGMNIAFARDGYLFGGRLKNNTNISSEIESMNIWYKTI